jgi:hypothetical protein
MHPHGHYADVVNVGHLPEGQRPQAHHGIFLRGDNRQVGPYEVVKEVLGDDLQDSWSADDFQAGHGHHDPLVNERKQTFDVIQMGVTDQDMPDLLDFVTDKHFRHRPGVKENGVQKYCIIHFSMATSNHIRQRESHRRFRANLHKPLFMKYYRLRTVARIVMPEMNTDVLSEIIADQANKIIETEPCMVLREVKVPRAIVFPAWRRGLPGRAGR